MTGYDLRQRLLDLDWTPDNLAAEMGWKPVMIRIMPDCRESAIPQHWATQARREKHVPASAPLP